MKEYVFDIASSMGIKISRVSLNGEMSGAGRNYILVIETEVNVVRAIIIQSELDSLQNCSPSGFLELKIKTALKWLKMQQDQLANLLSSIKTDVYSQSWCEEIPCN